MTDTVRPSLLSSLFLRAMDSDFAWQGLGRLRPADRRQDILLHHALVLAFVTSAPIALVFGIVLLAVPGNAQAVAVSGLVLATALNVALQFEGARCWNQRAAQLRGG